MLGISRKRASVHFTLDPHSWCLDMSLLFWLSISLMATLTNGIECWQCASVDHRMCPSDAKLVTSTDHDACITWSLANGTIILQNVVQMGVECSDEKINFWRSFIDLYYRASGGNVQCCQGDGCNRVDDDTESNANEDEADTQPVQQFLVRPDVTLVNGPEADAIPGAPLIFGPASNAPPSSSSLKRPSAAMGLLSSTSSLSDLQMRLEEQQQLLEALLRSSSLNKSPISPGSNLIPTEESHVNLLGFPQQPEEAFLPNANCSEYLRINSEDEWLPSTLMPLAFDRASRTKVGVFYVRFTSLTSNNNDHITVRLVDQQRSNNTMYSVKLYRVGSVALFVSRLTRRRNRNRGSGNLIREELRRQSINHVVNITDQNYSGFWLSVRDTEVNVGVVGDPITEPVLSWNDTDRLGPSDVFYFGLTSERSEASYGLNCEVSNLHFSDTCVSDEDCLAFPNTQCSVDPLNEGLDPGHRAEPFEQWELRDKLLKSCFCKRGYLRIRASLGCYDPIRNAVTLFDSCFADHHCHSLPNTECVADEQEVRFNHSCQCVPGNKPFDPDPRTGLIEGCSPLTEKDRTSIDGCSRRIQFRGDYEWLPERQFEVSKDENGFRSVFFVRLDGRRGSAIVRVIDERRSRNKMLGIRFNGEGVAILESRRVRSFLFGTTENDDVRASMQDEELVNRMRNGFVGFWMRYSYDADLESGLLSIGLNGSPLGNDFAILRWTDDSNNALRNVGSIGLTGSNSARVTYGVNCVLVDRPLGEEGVKPFVQIPFDNDAVVVSNDQATFPGANIGSVFGSGPLMNNEELLLRLQQQQRLQQLLQQRLLHQQRVGPNRRSDDNVYDNGPGKQTDRENLSALEKHSSSSTITEPANYMSRLKTLLPNFKLDASVSSDFESNDKGQRGSEKEDHDNDSDHDYVMPLALNTFGGLVGRN